MRPEVNSFAEAMEQELQNNDHKGGWENCELTFLLNKLDEETKELADAAKATAQLIAAVKLATKHDKELKQENIEAMAEIIEDMKSWTLSEAADVGNICMMIADILGALPQPTKEKFIQKP